MQFATKSTSVKKETINLYTYPPRGDIELKKFEELASSRLKALQKLDDLSVAPKSEPEEQRTLIWKHLKELIPVHLTNAEDVENDIISHFILRLAYCENEELRRWFLSQESRLLEYRFATASTATKNNLFVEYSDMFACEQVQEVDIPEELKRSTRQEFKEFFKVSFECCLDLIAKRKVYVDQGYAYVPGQEIKSLVLNIFRQKLSKALATSSRKLYEVDQDERLVRIFKALRSKCVGQDFQLSSNVTGTIKLEQLDMLAEESFPPCMLRLHQSLKEEHHLKHGGRLQYGLFLKGIGLTLDQSLVYWRKSFAPKIDSEKFDKGYAYNIRHSYGKEGKRASYTPYSCMKVIMSNPPGPGDHHGCYFRHSDSQWMKQHMVNKVGIGNGAANYIVELAEGGHYQLACQKYFEAKHFGKDQQQVDLSLTHPNQYFMESRKLRTSQDTSHISVQYEMS